MKESTTGTVTAAGPHPIASGVPVPAVFVRNDGADESVRARKIFYVSFLQ
jgi:hypothetical protein